MFIQPSTLRLSTHCLVAHNADVSKEHHASYARLIDFANRARLPAVDQAPDKEVAIRQLLGASSGSFTNWKSRGLSRDAALTAQRRLGCSATWLLTGTGQELSPAAEKPIDEAPSPPQARSVTDSQWQLLQDFEMLIPEDQHAIRQTLKEKADYARRVFAEMAKRHKIPPPVSDRRIEETFGHRPDKVKK